ncbi:hypothetical protein DL96DRAFT_1617989 [Flagelloscypha sp. PMI_526]|nr:hypothetical protein DL96DRAFT_1617989 [Flagelloscypha sp. PMI_526]
MFQQCRSFFRTPRTTPNCSMLVRKKISERENWNAQLTSGLNTKKDVQLLKQINETRKLQDAWDQWEKNRQSVEDMRNYLADKDPEMRDIAKLEMISLEEEMTKTISRTIPKLVAPKSPTKDYGALVEMKSGAGGSESNLFLEELMQVYLRICANASEIPVSETADEDSWTPNWKVEMVEQNKQDSGGVKGAIFEVKGPGAYDLLRFESGVHRVQRVPATESAGRVHTSTIAVLVMPLVEESDKSQEDLFRMEDIKIEVMRARGAGGQHVNKTESAVRLTHIPTGVTVAMQDERSQHQNKRRAFTVLRSRLLVLKMEKEVAENRAMRNNLVKSYDRSEKIRTYNWAQGRVTDHRIGLSVMNLEGVMEGLGMIEFLLAMRKQWEDDQMSEILNG